MNNEPVKPVTAGCQTVTPHLVVDDAITAIELYGRAFGAELLVRLDAAEGNGTVYSEVKLGNSVICVVDAVNDPQQRSPAALGGVSGMLWLHVTDPDAVFDQAVAAGCTVVAPMNDVFWGDRVGQLRDPFGHVWAVAGRCKEMSPAEVAQAAGNPLEGR